MVAGLLGLVRREAWARLACTPNDRQVRLRAALPPRAGCMASLLALAGLLLALPQAAQAQVGSARYASIVVDAASGNVLEAANADQPRFPASLTKLMTLYMAFEALRDHRISLDETVPISWHTASMSPVKLGLVPGTAITVEQVMLGMVTLSANDAACALGELLGGDEDRFGQMMTLRARALGMTSTTFRNASGLPDPEQVSTAHDLAVLARHIIQDFPNEYRYFTVPEFFFHGRAIMNHDTMLRTYPGADGLKTGYTQAAGHNLVTSAVRGGVRLIGVVMGAGSNGERDVHMTALLDDGFDRMDVPVMRRPSRMPALIAAASAATLQPPGQAIETLRPPLRLATARGRLARGTALRRIAEFAAGPRLVVPTGGRAVHAHPAFERVSAQVASPSRTALPSHGKRSFWRLR